MKLNPESLEVESFPTDADALSALVTAPVTVDPGLPTPQTYCFVCD